MNKKEERDNLWIELGPESSYVGTDAWETAHQNDSLSPDAKRYGWAEEGEPCPCGEECDCGTDCNCNDAGDCTTQNINKAGCGCGETCDCTDCDCGTAQRDVLHNLAQPFDLPTETPIVTAQPPCPVNQTPTPPADCGPERQNTNGQA